MSSGPSRRRQRITGGNDKHKEKTRPRSLVRSGYTRIVAIWTGKDRPAMPWVIDDGLQRPPRRKAKVPRALRHQWQQKKR